MEEVGPLQEARQPLLDDALESARENAGDGDDAVGGRVRAVALLVDAERVGGLPSPRKNSALIF